jgi:orotate phosphoribosyltransferase
MTSVRRPAAARGQFETNLLRDKVFRLIGERSFKKGRFTLASGRESNYYLDLKPTMFHPEAADALTEMILDRLSDLRVDYVGGLALGAVPLVSTVTLLSHRRATPIGGFFVRKEVKDHGTKKLVDGLGPNETLAGKRVVILDDVTTTGGSAMVAIESAQTLGAEIVLVLSIVDREEGATEFYRAQGLPFAALFTASEFMAA